MSTTEKRTISLPKKQADYLDSLVARGDYGSVSEAVRDGIRALRARDAEIEKWLREEVVPTYDEAMAHPERRLTLEEARNRLEELRLERQKGDA